MLRKHSYENGLKETNVITFRGATSRIILPSTSFFEIGLFITSSILYKSPLRKEHNMNGILDGIILITEHVTMNGW